MKLFIGIDLVSLTLIHGSPLHCRVLGIILEAVCRLPKGLLLLQFRGVLPGSPVTEEESCHVLPALH